MFLHPPHRNDVPLLLAEAHARRETITGWDLSPLNRILSHTPEDMTVTVEAGMTFSALQSRLSPHGQWVPLDPPGPESLSLERLLALNVSGPRRYGYGTVRDHVIGLRFAIAEGREIHSGGQVVKNVAGYDLHKLLIGAHGSLGIVVEVTFKLLPLPEAESIHDIECPDPKSLADRLDAIWNAPVQPVILDAYRLQAWPNAPIVLTVGFAGAREDVEWQDAWAREAGMRPAKGTTYDAGLAELSGLEAEAGFSVMPSQVVDAIRTAGAGAFVARLGNGFVRWRPVAGSMPRAGFPLQRSPSSDSVTARVKAAFDPNSILPPVPA